MFAEVLHFKKNLKSHLGIILLPISYIYHL